MNWNCELEWTGLCMHYNKLNWIGVKFGWLSLTLLTLKAFRVKCLELTLLWIGAKQIKWNWIEFYAELLLPLSISAQPASKMFSIICLIKELTDTSSGLCWNSFRKSGLFVCDACCSQRHVFCIATITAHYDSTITTLVLENFLMRLWEHT